MVTDLLTATQGMTMPPTDAQDGPATPIWGYPLPDDELSAADPVTVPADIVELDLRIAQLRRDKESAVDTENFDAAGQIRTEERRLMARRTAKVQQWTDGVDVVAVVHENEDLRRQVQQLRTLLSGHGIEAPEQGQAFGSEFDAPT